MAWQFAGRDPEAREKTALRVIVFFSGLAAFVTAVAAPAREGIRRSRTADVQVLPG